MNQKLANLCRFNDLGNIINEPKQLIGGLLHRMYKVETEQGIYCI